jgi:general stress protein CsbA
MNSFKIFLYLLVFPYLLYSSIKNKNNIVLIGTLVLLAGHIYKEFQNGDWIWPKDSYYIGTFIGILFVICSDDKLVQLIGLIKILADFRKNILKHDKYYWGN